MRLKSALVGNLQQAMRRELRAAERASAVTLRQGSEGLQAELRQQTLGAGLGRGNAQAWRARRFPANGESLGAAALVWSRSPQVMLAFENGATIRAGGGRYLAIPTGFNRAQGRRRTRSGGRDNSRSNVKVTPAEMVAARGLTFTRKNPNGPGLLWFLKVTVGQERSARSGRILDRAFAGGFHRIGSGRRGRTAKAIQHGAVPMFALVPQVTLRKRLDVKGAADRHAARLPALLAQNWAAEAARG